MAGSSSRSTWTSPPVPANATAPAAGRSACGARGPGSRTYDRWAAKGLPSWSYAHALPYFKKQETWEDGPSAHRGGDGPLGTCWSIFQDPLAEAYTAASQAAGLKWNADLNSGHNEGIGRNQNTIR